MTNDNEGKLIQAVPKDSSLMREWTRYSESPDYRNSFKWASDLEYRKGSMWACFLAGWLAGLERAASKHESINPASDQERHDGSPGAGAMGAVIEYRDRIRKIV